MPQVDIPQAEFKVVLLGDSHVGKSSLVTRFAEGYYRDSSRPATISATFVSKTIPATNGVSTKVQIWDTAGSAAFRAASSAFVRGSDAVIICYDVSNRESVAGMKVRLDEVLLYRRKRRREREEQRERQQQQQQQQHFFGGGRKQQQQRQRGVRGILSGMGDVVVAIAGLKADLIPPASNTNSTAATTSSSSSTTPSLPSSSIPSSPTRRTQRQRQNGSATVFVPECEVERLAETLGVLHFPTSAKTGLNVHELFTSVADQVLQSRLEEEDRPYGHGDDDDDDDNDLAHHPHPSSTVDNVSGGAKDVVGNNSSDGEVASPRRIRDKFDKYYVNETFTDEFDDDGGENKSNSATTMGSVISETTTKSLNRIRTGASNSEYGTTGDLVEKGGPGEAPERTLNPKGKTKTKKQRKAKQTYGDESSMSSSDNEEEKEEEEEEGGGGGLCAADEPFACQPVACGGGGDDGTNCVVQ